MKADSYRFDGSGKCRLDKLATNSKADGIDKAKTCKKWPLCRTPFMPTAAKD